MQTAALKRSVKKTETMEVLGLQGPDSVSAIDRALAATVGVVEASVSLDTGKATITYDAAETSIRRLQAAIKEAGYESLKPVHGEDGNCCGGCGG